MKINSIITMSVVGSLFAATAFPGAVYSQGWPGLSGQSNPDGPDVSDFAAWMTPQRAVHFSQFRHQNCPNYAVAKYYGGSLAVCNAFRVYMDQRLSILNWQNRYLDSIIQCQRAKRC